MPTVSAASCQAGRRVDYTGRENRELERRVVLCNVYRSERRAETYLYLPHGAPFDDLPEALRRTFGPPALVMQLRLSEDRPLARADVPQVMEQLETQGFYLQLPPELPVEEEISRRFPSIESGDEV